MSSEFDGLFFDIHALLRAARKQGAQEQTSPSAQNEPPSQPAQETRANLPVPVGSDKEKLLKAYIDSLNADRRVTVKEVSNPPSEITFHSGRLFDISIGMLPAKFAVTSKHAWLAVELNEYFDFSLDGIHGFVFNTLPQMMYPSSPVDPKKNEKNAIAIIKDVNAPADGGKSNRFAFNNPMEVAKYKAELEKGPFTGIRFIYPSGATMTHEVNIDHPKRNKEPELRLTRPIADEWRTSEVTLLFNQHARNARPSPDQIGHFTESINHIRTLLSQKAK